MNRHRLVLVLLGIALAAGAADLFRRNLGATDRGMPGLEFVIPSDYAVIPLPDPGLPQAAAALLEAVETRPRVAVDFTEDGSTTQLLVDADGGLIDERGYGRQGTVRRILWRGPVRERLRHLRDAGSLDVPGLPAPERRNPYH